ncbi:ParB/Srx family N-terminal domain-containing protein, partial [Bacillus cereus group sp. BC41]|uniref:ParB/Srx family N-terminal domain-containing protein n=1 Tax=Bacillus cereus group sp. BC41 TaxID=3445301 RepID=UPI003F21D9DB
VRSRLDGLDVLTESIREVGVQEPVRARRGDNGEVYVWDGQRRLLAAREAGVDKMLAVFGLRDHNGSEADRILDQLRTFTREDLNLV